MGRKHGPWTVESSERLYADEFAAVYVDEVRRPGVEPSRRVTMRMKFGVAVLAVDAEGKRLGKSCRHDADDGCALSSTSGQPKLWRAASNAPAASRGSIQAGSPSRDS